MINQLLLDNAQFVLEKLKAESIDDAEIVFSEETGFAVTARNGDVETLEHHQEKGFVVTVYQEQRSASASSSELSKSALLETVQKAVAMAQFTEVDPFNALPEADRLAKTYPDLDLYHPWQLTPADAMQTAIACETIARQYDARIKHSEGVTVSTYRRHKILANTKGFLGHFPSSIHAINCGLVAEQNGDMQREYDYTASRRADQLDDIALLAARTGEKTIRRLGAQKIKTQRCPVIFHAPLAKGLLSTFIAAISGGNLYRRTTFLLDHLEQKIFPDHISIYQRPHILAGIGSAPFDREGVTTNDLHYVEDGRLVNYVLSSYSARKLGMQTTGNAGGVFNLNITHNDVSLAQLLKQMDRGLLVTEMMGQGVRMMTGDYSRGAFGYWVENGEVQYPVHEITLAGNLKDMFANIVAVGNDVDHRGNIQTGSILISEMMLSGS